MFIVFEGCDRSGKSSQARRLARHLQSQGLRVHTLSFPDRSSPCTGPLLNAYLQGDLDLPPQASHLLFSANRWEKQPLILQWLEAGDWIIVDRYWYSGVAYSVGAHSLALDWAMGPDTGLPTPHCVVFLTMAGREDELEGRGDWGLERFERLEVQRAVAGAYERVAPLVTVPWVRVEGHGSEEAVFGRVLGVLEENGLRVEGRARVE